MIQLSAETEALARRLAEAQRLSVDEVLRRALGAQSAGGAVGERRRMTVEEMLAFGAEIAAMPVLDPSTPKEIMDDLNEL
jgi:antitoxin VapB